MTKKNISIKRIIEETGKIDLASIERIRARLRARIPKPRVKNKGIKPIDGQPVMTLNVTGFPLPRVNLYDGCLEVSKEPPDQAYILVEFPGPEKTVTTRASYDPKERLLKSVVPISPLKGRLRVLFPFREYFGLTEELKKADPKNVELKMAIGKWQRENNECEKDPSYKEEEQIERHDYYPVTMRIRYPYCMSRVVGVRCPIPCPYGAISIDSKHQCHIDPARCHGESYFRVDLVRREADITCWICKSEGNQCWEGKIRKILHVGERCCANCYGAYAPTGRNLMELCPYGAISVFRAESNGHSLFRVNPRLCRGCYECYNNILCFYNGTSEFSERVLRMVAHIGPKDF